VVFVAGVRSGVRVVEFGSYYQLTEMAQNAADYVNDQRPNRLFMYKSAEAEHWSMQFISSVNEFVDLPTGGNN